jgi:hypothetical protein
MRRGVLILLLGLLLGAAGFAGFYYLGTAACRDLMREPQPELAWLKKEFKLTDAEFARISRLHAAYLPQCAQRCQHIEALSQKLRELLTQATNVTPQIQALLAERAKTRSDCEAEMISHFFAVSRTMPPEQGRRYLEWVEHETVLRRQAMEARHHVDQAGPMTDEHPMHHVQP